MSSAVYLASYLAPLAPWLGRPGVSDVLVNRPGEVWIEDAREGMIRLEAPELTELALLRLARQIAAAAHQAVNREQPLLSASLPDGGRVQVVLPPAAREGVALAIRNHAIEDLSLEDLARRGMFSGGGAGARDRRAEDRGLAEMRQAGDLAGLLRQAVRLRRTIVISGGTSTGKTTLLGALLREADADERLILIEDAPEIQLRHANAVSLVAVRGEQGEARVDADDLLRAALRMRPDRILLGELRGAEAFAFLRAVNSGHPGSITTVHAESPAGAIDQIALLAMSSGLDLGWGRVQAYVRRAIEIVVQLERTRDGVRRIAEVRLPGDGDTPG